MAKQIEAETLREWLVDSAGETAVIDPSVSPDVYVELASRHGWSIRYVLAG